MNPPKSVLFIGLVWPEPTSSAAGVRMMQLLDLFAGNGFRVTFACSSLKTARSANLVQHQISEVNIRLNDSSFDDFIIELNPDIVVYDRYIVEEQFGWRVRLNCPKALQILDTEDLHFLRNYRQRHNQAQISKSTPFSKSKMAIREIASIYRSDLSLIISEFEMEILQDIFQIPSFLIHYLPILFEKENIREQESPSFTERRDFITIGNFLHAPNVDAVLYLKDTIWPIIRAKLPHANLHIYGAYPNAKMLNLTNDREGFIVKGETSDVGEVMKRSKVCLASIRFGAGIKGKVLEAFKHGTPCILTPVAAEGIVKEGEYPICNSAEQFANSAVEIYENKERWESLSNSGQRLLLDRFEKAVFEGEFFDRLEKLMSQKENNRSQNFIGAMLNYHHQQSTKFMSKWIEAKNKL